MERPASPDPGLGAAVGPPGRSTRSPDARSTLLLYRAAVTAVAAWSLLATTVLVWFLAQGGVVGLLDLLRRPGMLLSSRAATSWELGALGAFLAFLAAFLLCQVVGRGLMRLLAPRPLPWPDRLPPPEVPVRLLAFRSERPDAFTFTLLIPGRRLPWRREEVILVSEALLGTLDPSEWEAVVAHELGHVREYDGRYLTFLRTLARQMRWDPFLAAVAARLTRREEFLADDEAVALTGQPLALARAIFKASKLAPASSGAFAGLLGPGGRAGRRQAIERIRRLVTLSERDRFEGEGG
jgi:Zn-dependent protease with chaperone function